MQTLIDFFGTDGFIPHGYCLTWSPILLWLNVLSDAIITLAYYSIPLSIAYFVWQRKDMHYRWLLLMFGVFIVACGTTHLLSVVTIWLPLYWLDASVKAITAIVSVATALAMLWVVPRALTLPSPAQLEVQHNISLYTRSLIEASLDPLVTISPEGKITDVNIATEHVTGKSRGELIGTDFSDYFTDPDKARKGYQQVLSEGAVTDYPLALRHQDGHITDVLYNASLYRDETGKVIGVFAAARDLTKLQRAQNELRSASLYTRSLIEASLDPLVTISPEGKITDVNAATEQVTGKSRDKLIGTDFSDYFTEPDKARKGYQRVLLKGAVTDYPLAIRHRDGHVTDVLYNASLYRDEAQNVIGVFAAARDLTKLKHAENELRSASLYTRSLIEANLDPLVTISPEGKITDVNIATELVTGRRRSELIGTDFSDYFTEPDKARDGYQQVLRDGSVTDYPLALRHQDGHITEVLYNASLYRDETGKEIGVFAAARDVTELKRAENELRSASLYTRSLIEASLDPLVTISPEGKITDVNLATEHVTGKRRSELIGTDFSDYFTEPDKARDGYQQVLSEGSVTDYPLALRHQDGHITEVLYNASLYRNETGKEIGVFAAARDVTERNKAENALREYAAIIESSDDAIIGKTLQGIITSWNDGATRLFGFSRDEVLGKNIILLIPAPYQREEEMIMKRIRNGDSVKHYETVRRCKDGKLIDISVTVSPIRDKGGNITGASKVARDISERKQTEELLRAASLYTRSLIEASLDPLVTISPEGKITDVNQATEQVTGRNRSELIGTDFSDYFTEPDKARDGYQQVLKQGSVTDYPLALRHQDGHISDVLYNASLYRDEAGKVIGVFAAARDVTERNKAEQALLALKNDLENRVIARTAELESANKELEAFSYSVSHDLRTPLRAIDGYSLMLLEDYESKLDDEGKRLLNVVRNNTKRMAQLIDDILHFSRSGRTEMSLSEVDMEALVRDVLDGLHPLMGERKLQLNLGGLPGAVCDQAMMHQVFENLLSNAIKFTRKNEAARIDIGGRIEDGKAIYYVKDNGVGFDMQYAEKLFGVFQRLHGVDEFEGTGIGLAIVKRIVNRHGGTVWAEGEVGKGAAIYFTLPAKEAQHG